MCPGPALRGPDLSHVEAHARPAPGGRAVTGHARADAGLRVRPDRGGTPGRSRRRCRMELNRQLSPKLKPPRLSGALATLDARHRQALAGQWASSESLERPLEGEIERRAQKQLALRVRRAALNTTQTLEGFDRSFNPTINRRQVLHLAGGEDIRQKRNVLICRPTGVCTSHLAQALAHEACRQGYDVLFANTHKMLQHLHGGRADGTWTRRLSGYLRPELLVLGDFGLKPLADPAPSDLYDGVNERYETGSILVTSNRAPAEWPDLFGNPLLASAGLDRLAHHAETLVITERSFRAQERQPLAKTVGELAKGRR
jgi:DNA replication protein DnaC